ncbi:MAG: hypothetical protein FWD59_03125 [Micrococcales bacterium]|nr:hypothetical protein [Micrococcales bacterium]
MGFYRLWRRFVDWFRSSDDSPRRDKITMWVVVGILFAIGVGIFMRAGNKPRVEPEIVRSPDGAIVETVNASIRFAQAGDCILGLPEDDIVDKVKFVPCSEPHRVYVMGFTKAFATAEPKDGAAAYIECVDIAETVTGKNPNRDRTDYTPALLPLPPQEGRPPGFLCMADYGMATAPPLPVTPTPSLAP